MSPESSSQLSMAFPLIASDLVAGLKTGLLGGRTGADRTDFRGELGDAGKGIDEGKDDDGQEEIGERSCQHDGDAFGNRLQTGNWWPAALRRFPPPVPRPAS